MTTPTDESVAAQRASITVRLTWNWLPDWTDDMLADQRKEIVKRIRKYLLWLGGLTVEVVDD